MVIQADGMPIYSRELCRRINQYNHEPSKVLVYQSLLRYGRLVHGFSCAQGSRIPLGQSEFGVFMGFRDSEKMLKQDREWDLDKINAGIRDKDVKYDGKRD